ncbi:metacaspase-like protein, partial [Plasmodium reichenowi]
KNIIGIIDLNIKCVS